MQQLEKKPLKVLHLCESDIGGGAARAAFRIHRALVTAGVDSRMAVMHKMSDDWRVIGPSTSSLRSLAKVWANMANCWAAVIHGKRNSAVNDAAFPGFFRFMKVPFVPDVLHLHYVMGGMIRLEDLRFFRRPIVWTLHDEWPLTGGCSYDGGCERYREGCGRCPLIQPTRMNDITRKTYKRKQRAWEDVRLELVALCHWMKTKIEASPVFSGHRVHLIPNPIDLSSFKPYPRTMAREILGLNPHKKYVLFGAFGGSEWEKPGRKGGDLLLQALQTMPTGFKETVELLVFGAAEPESKINFGFPVRYCGKLSDDITLALHYSAANLFVAPSREDNLPNTVVESLACDTPVVAFNIGGMPDMISHKETGWLSPSFDVNDLAAGISWMLNEGESLHGRMRAFAEARFMPDAIARAYGDVYDGLLKEPQK